MNTRIDRSVRTGLRLWYWGWKLNREWTNLCRKVRAWWYG